MQKWKIKAIVQKIISYLPYKHRINYLFQKYVTKGVILNDEYLEIKLRLVHYHIKYFRKYYKRDKPRRLNNQRGKSKFVCFELGSGWYPIIPVSMYLTGAGKIISLDILPWMTKKTIIKTIKKFQEWRETIDNDSDVNKLEKYLKYIDEDRWKKLAQIIEKAEKLNLKDICQEINLELQIKDVRNTDYEEQSIDLICSNNTFEHIYPEVLRGILKEFRRLIKPNGVMIHFIDMSDHFAHFDKSITIYNFLKYSDRQWRIIDNSIQRQNRMRFRDYKQMYRELEIPVTEEDYISGDIKKLEEINLDGKFKKYSKEELAISHGYLITLGT